MSRRVGEESYIGAPLIRRDCDAVGDCPSVALTITSLFAPTEKRLARIIQEGPWSELRITKFRLRPAARHQNTNAF